LFIQRIFSALIALIGIAILSYALLKLRATNETADKSATAALNANGGYLQADEMASYRQIGAEVHLEKCALLGVAGTVLMGVGLFNATTPRPRPAK
jgi:hypothetical protein